MVRTATHSPFACCWRRVQMSRREQNQYHLFLSEIRKNRDKFAMQEESWPQTNWYKKIVQSFNITLGINTVQFQDYVTRTYRQQYGSVGTSVAKPTAFICQPMHYHHYHRLNCTSDYEQYLLLFLSIGRVHRLERECRLNIMKPTGLRRSQQADIYTGSYRSCLSVIR
jgi:hypothetical protein